MSMKVLIVDDERLARSRLRTLLGDCKAPLVQVGAEAANAAQAMSYLQHEAFDAVLLDIHMPGADGMALALFGAAVAVSSRHLPEDMLGVTLAVQAMVAAAFRRASWASRLACTSCRIKTRRRWVA